MWIVIALASVLLICLILIDSFETTVLPRRVTHRFRFARFFFQSTWFVWSRLTKLIPSGKWREAALALFGPWAVLAILVAWVWGFVLGFAMLHWALDTPLHGPDRQVTFWTHFYWSGVTFFTLGYGDVAPVGTLGRALAVLEAGLGFGFLAVMIGYLPVIFQTFSRREVTIGMLDARAGSPPSAGQLLMRLGRAGNLAAVDSFMAEWEVWSAELLESHLSFPLLSFYRSQHDNQSWLAALTAILDTCTLLMVGVKGHNPYRAQLTFAMARHTVVDLALVFKVPPHAPDPDRLPNAQLQLLRKSLREAGLELHEGTAIDAKLAEVRGMYEPFVDALSRFFLLNLPPIMPESASADNWQRSAWMKRAPELGSLSTGAVNNEHF
jgi:hypothetical protein